MRNDIECVYSLLACLTFGVCRPSLLPPIRLLLWRSRPSLLSLFGWFRCVCIHHSSSSSSSPSVILTLRSNNKFLSRRGSARYLSLFVINPQSQIPKIGAPLPCSPPTAGIARRPFTRRRRQEREAGRCLMTLVVGVAAAAAAPVAFGSWCCGGQEGGLTNAKPLLSSPL